MSYDMSIDYMGGSEDFNYTYNVSTMWYIVGGEKGIRSHYGMTGKDASQVLIKMLVLMLAQPELARLNPDNDWGDYEGATEFIFKLVQASLRHPEGVWRGD